MPAPHEILAAPLTLWLADVGTAFPLIDAAPAVAWVLVGTEGPNNYDDGGVVASHGEEVFDFKPSGSTMPSKRFRIGEEFKLKLDLVDLSPAVYAKAMNNAAVTTIAAGVGVAGLKKFSLFRGTIVNSFAVLARGMSSVDNTLTMQYVISKAFVSVNGDVIFDKTKVAALPLEIETIRHSSADIVECQIQTAVAS